MLMHRLSKRALYLLGIISVVSVSSPVNASEQSFQQPPLTLVAADVLPAQMLSGDGYTVDSKVINDGVQNTYTLRSQYGVSTVTGTDELHARIMEVNATRALEKLEDSDEFKDAAKASVSGMVEGGKALFKAPVETTKGAAKGVGRWLRNVGSSVNSDDPHQDNAFQTTVGYDAVKRGYAVAMGVDPYTEFEPFQERLGEVARAATAGGMVTSAVINVGADGLAGAVTSVSKTASMQKLLKDNPPSSLARINKESLLAMGVKDYQADALLKNYNYTPAEMTVICEALKRMGAIEGREIFVAFATSAPDRQVAHFMQYYAEMLADYITTVETGDIVDLSESAWLVSRSGTLIGAFPIDYLAWTTGVSESIDFSPDQMTGLGIKRKELLIRGQVSPQARAGLQGQGWKITENVSLAVIKDEANDEEKSPASPEVS